MFIHVRAADPRRPSDPTLTRLSTLFKPPIDLVFPGDFGAAREEAKSKKKWILITVIDKDEFACLVLNRDLWPDADVKSLVKENFVFLYVCYVCCILLLYVSIFSSSANIKMDSKSADGQRHATFYPIDSYPYVAIIDPTTGERVKTWSHAVSPLEFQSDGVCYLLFTDIRI